MADDNNANVFVGWAKARISAFTRVFDALCAVPTGPQHLMPNYRRAKIKGGTYFFTLTLTDRSSDLLVRDIARLRRVYVDAQQRRPFTTLAVCVLPDHLHAIWSLPAGDCDFAGRWNLIKSSFSRELPAASPMPSKKREKGIWQRRYWEHVIRDIRDLERHIAYIHFNPVKHGLVQRVRNWPHSSFHQYVTRGDLPADWGGDIRNTPDDTFGE